MKTEILLAPRNWRKLTHHPLAALAPFGTGIDLDQLREHIRQHGYDKCEPIVLFEGMIVDGRHRHHVCVEADVRPEFVDLKATPEEARAFCMKKLHRQHFTDKERAEIAAKLATAPVGNPALIPPIGGIGPMTTAEAAETMQVSTRSVERAKARDKALQAYLDSKGDDYEPPVCPRCERVGRAQNCQNCANLLTEEYDRQKKAPHRQRGGAVPRNGQYAANWQAFHAACKTLETFLDDVARHYECTKDRALPGIRRLHEEWFKGVKEWYERVSKQKVPK